MSTTLLVVVVLIIILILKYNSLRSDAEEVKETFSNVKVALRKRASLVNQLIDVVRSYSDHEKLVMLKVSEDNTTGAIESAYRQTDAVLATVAGMAQRFPDLRANEQFIHLQQSIRDSEDLIQKSREAYNAKVREYNSSRGGLPWVLFTSQIGFSVAPYLNFDGDGETTIGSVDTFAQNDAEHLKRMFANVGQRAAGAGRVFVEHAGAIGSKAIEAAQNMSRDTQDGKDGPTDAPEVTDERTQ